MALLCPKRRPVEIGGHPATRLVEPQRFDLQPSWDSIVLDDTLLGVEAQSFDSHNSKFPRRFCEKTAQAIAMFHQSERWKARIRSEGLFAPTLLKPYHPLSCC